MARRKKFTEDEIKAVIELMPRILAAANEPLEKIDFVPAELNINLDEVVSAACFTARGPAATAAPLPPLSGTHPILIRVPECVIRAFKIKAESTGGHYQTLMNRALKEAAEGLV